MALLQLMLQCAQQVCGQLLVDQPGRGTCGHTPQGKQANSLVMLQLHCRRHQHAHSSTLTLCCKTTTHTRPVSSAVPAQRSLTTHPPDAAGNLPHGCPRDVPQAAVLQPRRLQLCQRAAGLPFFLVLAAAAALLV